MEWLFGVLWTDIGDEKDTVCGGSKAHGVEKGEIACRILDGIVREAGRRQVRNIGEEYTDDNAIQYDQQRRPEHSKNFYPHARDYTRERHREANECMLTTESLRF